MNQIDFSTAFSNLFETTLGLKKNDNCAFIYSDEFNHINNAIQQKCNIKGISYNGFFCNYDGKIPPKIIDDILLGDNFNVIILGFSHVGIWHTESRKKAKYDLKKRLINFVCSPSYLVTHSEYDISLINELGEKIKSILSESKEVKIKTELGTELVARVENNGMGKKFEPFLEAGPYCSPGSGGDYPFGEVGFGPKLKSVKGKIVFDFKIQHIGFLKNPFEIQIEEDEIQQIKGDLSNEDKFKKFIEKDAVLKLLSEVSIGLNPYIKNDQNINFIPEEKKLGTIHFGFGGNFSYGTRIGPHFDGVMQYPTLEIDNLTVLNKGKFNKNVFEPNINAWLKTFDLIF